MSGGFISDWKLDTEVGELWSNIMVNKLESM
jgi:hypothetical protein